MARGYCNMCYHQDLSWTGVKCVAKLASGKKCGKGAYKSNKLCENHRSVAYVRNLRRQKLCNVKGCGKDGTVRVYFQDGKEMHKTILKFCFDHLRTERASKNARNAEDKKNQKKSCKICHSNPAELCVGCREEKR